MATLDGASAPLEVCAVSPRSLRIRLARAFLAVGVIGAPQAAPAAAGAAPAGARGPAGGAGAASLPTAPRSYAATIANGRKAAARLLAETGASSISLAFVDGARVAWHQTFGVVDAAGTKPAEATMYGLGSVRKMVLAVAVMQLVDTGKVSLDAPVVRYITDFSMASPEFR